MSLGLGRATVLSAVVALAVALVLASAARATATCPPLAPGGSPFELLARHAPASGQRAPAELMELVRKGLMNPLVVSPPSGPAPLTVEIRWWVYPVENPVRVEIDVNGDGVAEWSQPGFGPEYGRRTYTYQREGQYQFTAAVHERGRRVTIYTAQVKVLSVSAFDAEIQSRWMTMKAALRQGDIPAALECVHSESRSKYRERFKALSERLARDVDQILTTIRFIEHDGTEAIYESFRTDRGIPKSFEVRFEVDVDGVWRLRSF